MESHLKLTKDEGESLLKDARGSLMYLTITRPKIAYSVGIVSQFMQDPRNSH